MKRKRNLQHDICRTIGHAWQEVDTKRQTDFGWYFCVQCERCNTYRLDTINLRGDLNSRKYTYPEGYKSSEKLTKSQYREIIMQRMYPIRVKKVS